MTTRSITLLLPEIAQADNGWPEMPALQTLLSKGSRESLPEGFTARLFSLFAMSVKEGEELPVAALSALGDGVDSRDGWWLCADPVHLVADRDQLFLSASSALQLSQKEADSLMAELNRIYNEDGWHFFAAQPQRWYLRLPQSMAMHTVSTSDAMGRRVGEVLPQGEDAMAWQRVMTEVQMLLHSSTVNVNRTEKGSLAVNGIWFWGGGSLPAEQGETDWQRVISEQPLARGLALQHGIPVASSIPADPGDAGAKLLWVGEGAQHEQLEQYYFAPLLNRLQEGKLSQLVIELPGQGRWCIERKALRRWWRRRKPLSSLLKGAK